MHEAMSDYYIDMYSWKENSRSLKNSNSNLRNHIRTLHLALCYRDLPENLTAIQAINKLLLVWSLDYTITFKLYTWQVYHSTDFNILFL